MSYIDKAVELLTKFEGFTKNASWDVNAYRLGYGSDTITFSNGSFRKVVKGDQTTVANAKKDLARRIPQFANKVKKQIGSDTWDKLQDNTKASLISIAYNYGSVPHESLRKAIKTRNKKIIAKEWIDSTKFDNKNTKYYNGLQKRRKLEAEFILEGKDNFNLKPILLIGGLFLAYNFATNPRFKQFFL